MKVVSADQMRQLEMEAGKLGLPSSILMEKAGLAVARQVRAHLQGVIGKRLLVLVGPGNNGGDGLVAARHLRDWGAQVQLYLVGARPEADPNLKLVLERGLPILEARGEEGLLALGRALARTEGVVDAVLGTGRARPLEGLFKAVLERVAEAKGQRPGLPIFALDLPSGLDADGLASDPAALAAAVTITLAYPKRGLFAFPGAEKVGKLVTVDIGIPPDLAQDVPLEVLTPSWARRALPPRPLDANKGSFGRVLAVVGSVNYIGAAFLACAGAIRVGAGLVTLATSASLHPILAAKLTEVTHLPLPEAASGIIAAEGMQVVLQGLGGYDVLLIGCGLGQHPATREFATQVLFSLPPEVRAAVDADGLNALASVPQWWQRLAAPCVLTPHPGEMARLRGLTVAEVQRSRLEVAQEAAALWGQVVVLKGAYSVIAAPEGQVRLSPWANPGLASAGTGDVLAGAIAGFMAQGLPSFTAACLGVYVHGAAAELVREELGDAGMAAADLLPALPWSIQGVKKAPARGTAQVQ